MKRIVVLTDFSEASKMAVDSAINCAAVTQVDLLIWHNLDAQDRIAYELDEGVDFRVLTNDSDLSFDLMNSWRASIKSKGVKAEVIVSSGTISEMLKQINAYNPMMIFIGRNGHSQTQERLGSFSYKVLTKSEVPVCILNTVLSNITFDKIVFAAKFDSKEIDAFKEVLKLLNFTANSEIMLLSIDTVGYFTEPSQAVKESMNRFAEVAEPLKVRSFLYKDYSIPSGIRHFIKNSNAELLIMNGAGMHPIKRLFQKNAAIESAVGNNIPVLIMH